VTKKITAVVTVQNMVAPMVNGLTLVIAPTIMRDMVARGQVTNTGAATRPAKIESADGIRDKARATLVKLAVATPDVKADTANTEIGIHLDVRVDVRWATRPADIRQCAVATEAKATIRTNGKTTSGIQALATVRWITTIVVMERVDTTRGVTRKATTIPAAPIARLIVVAIGVTTTADSMVESKKASTKVSAANEVGGIELRMR